jgi:hypothetical protein
VSREFRSRRSLYLVGHSNTSTTETVYRQQLRVISTGAEVMDHVFKIG